jgi:hypothetical protein
MEFNETDFLPEFFGFPVPGSFHQCSTLIFMYPLLLSGQSGNRGTWIEKSLVLSRFKWSGCVFVIVAVLLSITLSLWCRTVCTSVLYLYLFMVYILYSYLSPETIFCVGTRRSLENAAILPVTCNFFSHTIEFIIHLSCCKCSFYRVSRHGSFIA